MLLCPHSPTVPGFVGWFPAGAAAAVLGGGLAIGAITAAADPSLPTRSAAQLLTDLQQARVDGISGTVVARADLGLPAIPAGDAGSSDLTSLISGTHTLRVWYSGPDHARVALLGTLGETDVITNGTDVWIWNSKENKATHTARPKDDKGAPTPLPTPTDQFGMTPDAMAKAALAMLEPSTQVTTDGSASVAGRAAYELRLAPKDPASLIGSIKLDLDAVEHVPLRVVVEARGSDSPAIDVGFTQVSFARPDAAEFTFNPPPGATVEEGMNDAKPSTSDTPQKTDATPDGKRGMAVIGTGWTSVVVTRMPQPKPDQNGQPGENDNPFAGILQALPKVSGPWGSGRIVTSRLFTALVTDDGRLLIGAVNADRLQQAAADPKAQLPLMTEPAVLSRGLTKRFGEHAAVDGIDLAVPRGSVYGFLGPNGSGKTTTIRLLLGLIRPTAGEHELLGAPMPAAAGSVLPRVGSLVEGPAFHPYLSGRDNLLRLDAADRTADARTARTRVMTALERVGLRAAAGKRYRVYSLGMRQRLALAAALLARRELLVLDEPTNGLDPQGTREVRSLITGLAADGTTVMLSTHLLSEVEQICDHVGVMHLGKLVAQAPLARLRAGVAARARLETDRPEPATEVFTELGLGDIRTEPGPAGAAVVTAVLGPLAPEKVVAALVHAGVAVRGFAASRADLEELFVSLTGEGFDVSG